MIFWLWTYLPHTCYSHRADKSGELIRQLSDGNTYDIAPLFQQTAREVPTTFPQTTAFILSNHNLLCIEGTFQAGFTYRVRIVEETDTNARGSAEVSALAVASSSRA